jgi:F0F1-type ATP synthase membrane subunit b/b'
LHDAKEAADKVKNDIVARAQKEAEEKIQMAVREIEIQKKAALCRS